MNSCTIDIGVFSDDIQRARQKMAEIASYTGDDVQKWSAMGFHIGEDLVSIQAFDVSTMGRCSRFNDVYIDQSLTADQYEELVLPLLNVPADQSDYDFNKHVHFF